MAIDVFLSYSHHDQARVQEITRFLDNHFVVWSDHDIISGTDFSEDIFEKLGKAGVALIAWSQHAAQSEWVSKESRAALSYCPTIPILLDGTPLPPHLAHLDAIDLRSTDSVTSEVQLAQLVRDVKLRLRNRRQTNGKEIYKTQIDNNVNIILKKRRQSQLEVNERFLPGFLEAFSFIVILIILNIWAIYHSDPNHIFTKQFIRLSVFYNAPITIYFIYAIFSKTLNCKIIAAVLQIGAFVLAPSFDSIIFGPSKVDHKTQCLMTNLKTDLEEQLETARLVAKLRGAREQAGEEAGGDGWEPQIELRQSREPEHEKDLVSAPTMNPTIRKETEDEFYFINGCVDGDWQQVASTNAFTPPKDYLPFSIEDANGHDWSTEAATLLRQERYDEVRLLLATKAKTDPAALNLVAVLDAQSLGSDPNPRAAFGKFYRAAQAGNRIATANLGICYLLGFGVAVDPIYGAKLLESSIKQGAEPLKATWLLRNGVRLLQIADFAEVVKTIELESARGSNVATAVKGILVAQGYSSDPCAPRCAERAEEIAQELKAKGAKGLAAVVEMNAKSERGPDAVREVSLRLPEALKLSASERFSTNEVKATPHEFMRERMFGGARR